MHTLFLVPSMFVYLLLLCGMRYQSCIMSKSMRCYYCVWLSSLATKYIQADVIINDKNDDRDKKILALPSNNYSESRKIKLGEKISLDELGPIIINSGIKIYKNNKEPK